MTREHFEKCVDLLFLGFTKPSQALIEKFWILFKDEPNEEFLEAVKAASKMELFGQAPKPHHIETQLEKRRNDKVPQELRECAESADGPFTDACWRAACNVVPDIGGHVQFRDEAELSRELAWNDRNRMRAFKEIWKSKCPTMIERIKRGADIKTALALTFESGISLQEPMPSLPLLEDLTKKVRSIR